MHNAGTTLAIIALSLTMLSVAALGQNVAESQTNSLELASSNSQEIPLGKVWSNRIGGTRDIYELEANVPDRLMRTPREQRGLFISEHDHTLTQQIARKLLPERTDLTDKPKMFAVLGQDAEAFQAAHQVIVDGKEPQQNFSSGDNITLVFFSRWYSRPIHIHRITREANKVRIEYKVGTSENFPRRSFDRVHLALIPIASVQPEELSVEVNRLASENQEVERSLQNPVRPSDSIDYMVSGPCRIEIR